jgi:hypothetical protein
MTATLISGSGCGKSKKPNGAEDKSPQPEETGSTPTVNNLPAIQAQKQFQASFAAQEGTSPKVEEVLLTPSGSHLIATTGISSKRYQVWALESEPKMLYEGSGHVNLVSPDGIWIGRRTPKGYEHAELVTGKTIRKDAQGSGNYYFRSPDSLILPLRSAGWEQGNKPFQIVEYDTRSWKSLPVHNAGDDDRVELAPPLSHGREIIFGVPAINSIRVYDFEARKVTRQVALADPRPYGGPGKFAHWSDFNVSPDGKWIVVRRGAMMGREPAPTELFDGSTGSLVGMVRFKDVIGSGPFVPNRDKCLLRSSSAKGSSYQAGDIVVFDLKAKAVSSVLRGLKLTKRATVSADGRLAASADYDNNIAIWSLDQLK